MGFLAAVRVWFQGKKTILGGTLLIVVGVAGAFYGKLSLIDATTIAAAGISVCGIGAKANHFLAALSQVAQAGVDYRMGNRTGAIEDLKPVVVDLAQQVGPQLVPAPATAAPAPTPSQPSQTPSAPVAELKPAPPLPFTPALSGDDAMRPGPARTASAEEWAALQKIARGEG